MKTVVHTYQYDTRKPEEKQEYLKLKASLKSQGLQCFETWGSISHYRPDLDGVTVTLETKHIFDNQWNATPPGGDKTIRLFDWAQDYTIDASRYIKKGHWLEQTADMREIRRDTVACGYCGHQEPAQKGNVFCPECLDSGYLTVSDLPLTRMQAVDVKEDRAPLTEAESDYLLPLYRTAQREGNTARGRARAIKARQNAESKRAEALRNAEAEYAAKMWILDNRPGLIGNFIYYEHTSTGCFGWRKPLDGEAAAGLEHAIYESGFPCAYEIKKS